MENVILTGFMGSGKTTVGKCLAYDTGFDFYDSDTEIENLEGLSVTDIFKYKGEAYFREKETEFLRAHLSNFKHFILATGGGIVLKDENRSLLKNYGKVVYLCGSLETLYNNISKNNGFSSRPIIRDNNNIKDLEKILNFRQPFYKDCHMIIDIDNCSIEEIANEIMKGM